MMEDEVVEKKPVGRPPKAKPTDWTTRKRRRVDLSAEAELNFRTPNRPGFVRRWVNDTPGRVARFQRMDYEPVIDEDGAQIQLVVGKNTDGRRAILMETPELWYKESQDQKAIAIPDPKTMKESQAGDGEYIPDRNGRSQTSAVGEDKLR